MASDYEAIKKENIRRYGTDIGRIGPMLLADRYDDRTHFIFELLQNAEDALKRREGYDGPRSVTFALSERDLRVCHYGELFSEADVRGICGIGEGTKDLTAIGRFGIGFKSVYAFTDRPEIHSGNQHFAIDSFVWPRAIPAVNGVPGETTFILPLRPTDASAREEIAAGLRRLGPRTLLFLREIAEISWSVKGGASGLYLRSEAERVAANARKVVVIGEEHGVAGVTEETWLVCSRDVLTSDSVWASSVEVAFMLGKSGDGASPSVQPIDDSVLVAFFPTIVPTNLGLLVQGPYRTTPSRDNVPRSDPWNQHLVQETATLLVGALRSLRDLGLLDASALRSMPLDPTKFGEEQMFAPLFHAVREALSAEPLLPRFREGHASAKSVRLARTQELRELVTSAQLSDLFGECSETFWLSEEITQDRTPDLRQYLMRDLGITEVTPETLLPRLDRTFLEAQSDEWTLQLYEFLHGQPALLRQGRLRDLPLVRLEDGRHVTAKKDGQPQAFLPGPIATDFPTVRRAVCGTEPARALLSALGLTEPDPVDDVVWNVLPKYGSEVDVEDYEADIRRILAAFGTDSKAQREKLLAALRQSSFVMTVDAGGGSKRVSKPDCVYLATERLKELFAGVAGVLLLDDSYACIRGEECRDLLEACGATRYLQPVPSDPNFTWEQLRKMRVAAGYESRTWEEPLEDHTLRGLDRLLSLLPRLDAETRRKKASLLWEALGDVEDRRGRGSFSGTYRWTYYQRRSATFDAAFVRQLNETAWVPDANGDLQRPGLLVFDTLGWKPDPFLLSKIRFRPAIIETLAREAGIELGVLDLLKKLGVTSETELRARLGIKQELETPGAPGPDDVKGALESLLGDSPVPTPPVPAPTGSEPSGSVAGRGDDSGTRSPGGGGTRPGASGGARTGGHGKRTPGGTGGRPFISYVGAHPDDEPDPDWLNQPARMALEEKAIGLVLAGEPQLRRTPTHNPGYDLFEAGRDGQPIRWIEVKAMTGGLRDRPVGLSRTQFESAREHGEAYWLYVVEHAGDDSSARIVRIQDPAGKARTFTFDRGWLDVADLDTEREERED